VGFCGGVSVEGRAGGTKWTGLQIQGEVMEASITARRSNLESGR
jgi:hypothetical protein